MMKYRVSTYFTFFGTKSIVELPDSSYGEWIIYENEIPRFHINCFSNLNSDQMVNKLIADKKETIESIIAKINYSKKTNLSLGRSFFIKIQINSTLMDLYLSALPDELLENL